MDGIAISNGDALNVRSLRNRNACPGTDRQRDYRKLGKNSLADADFARADALKSK